MNVKHHPFFSVIIPTYNRRLFLEKALRSVLDQTFSDLEVIIVDDGSTDGTQDMIAHWDDPRMMTLRQENGGPAKARKPRPAAC